MTHFQNIKKDTINHYFLDTRAKIIIVYKSNASDTICISGFGCCINNSTVYHDNKFISFIEKLIKKRDSTFKYKNESRIEKRDHSFSTSGSVGSPSFQICPSLNKKNGNACGWDMLSQPSVL